MSESERQLDTTGPERPAAVLPELFEEAYEELRHLAGWHFQRESPGHTLQPTAVVHEAFIRLVKEKKSAWESRAQFLSVASGMMRRIMIDHARKKKAAKRGGRLRRIPLEEGAILTVDQPDAFLAVCEALDRLKALNERQGQVVELRFFGGLTLDEIAEVMNLSRSCVDRAWRTARAWLQRELSDRAGVP